MQWYDEVNRLCPGTPVVLVGLKTDLRDDPDAIEDMRRKSLRFVESAAVSNYSLTMLTLGRTNSPTNRSETVYRMFRINRKQRRQSLRSGHPRSTPRP
jgi:GTPase SAR1 family protein